MLTSIIFKRFFSKTIDPIKYLTKDSVEYSIKDNALILTMHKESTLNAIDLNAVRNLSVNIKNAHMDGSIKCVLLRSGFQRAFCAGGDVKSLILAKKQGSSTLPTTFFKSEYALNHMIGTFYKKPFISLVGGICMGGGVGLSVHGTYRVVAENTLFAMPETMIGFFPDVGVGYFLSKLENNLGMYLALTGSRVTGRDLYHMGFATHFCRYSNFPNLLQDLTSADKGKVDDILNSYHKRVFISLKYSRFICKMRLFKEDLLKSQYSLLPLLPFIEEAFKFGSVAEIMDHLKTRSSEQGIQGSWASSTLAAMRSASPTSLCVTHHQLRLYKTFSSLGLCLLHDFRLATRFLASGDFTAGVESMLINKDRNPKWSPSRFEDISQVEVERYFSPLDNPLDEFEPFPDALSAIHESTINTEREFSPGE